MRAFLYNPWLSIPIRIALGIIFIYSSWPKLQDPPAFAQVLWNYQLLSSALINPVAMILPWLELFAGLTLIAGVLRRGSALVLSCMLLVFAAALAINLARGNPIDCGCFSVSPVQKSKEELLSDMKLGMLGDFGMLVMALQVFATPVTWRRNTEKP